MKARMCRHAAAIEQILNDPQGDVVAGACPDRVRIAEHLLETGERRPPRHPQHGIDDVAPSSAWARPSCSQRGRSACG